MNLRRSIALLICLIVGAVAPCWGAGFKDLPATNEAAPYVDQMVGYGIISGYPDQTFRGEKRVTRAEFAKILLKSVQLLEKKTGKSIALTKTGTLEFKDLPPTHWAYPFVAALVNNYGLISGYPDNTFKPKKSITRYEMATTFGKAMKKFEKALGKDIKTYKPMPYTDVIATHWAYEHVRILAHYMVYDVSVTTYDGNVPVNRYETATVAAKFINSVTAMIEVAPTFKVGSTIAGTLGNIVEGASGTNNWSVLSLTGTYNNGFDLFDIVAEYEFIGRYLGGQLMYMTPGTGSTINASLLQENRIDLAINTFPKIQIADWPKINGIFGIKHVNLSNSMAPANFTGLNLGVLWAANVFDQNIKGRAAYALPVIPAQANASVLGTPTGALDYEAGIDTEIFQNPVTVGLAGESMLLNNGAFYRYYNMFFVRHVLF